MSEENTPAPEGEQEKQAEFKPITSQEELNRLIGDRIGKVKSQYADYDDLKAKASKFDEVEEKNKTELQKAQERAEAAERRATEFEHSALVSRIAVEEGVIPEVLKGSTEEELRNSAARVKEWRDGNKKTPPAPKSLKSGSSGEPKTGEKGRAAAALRSLRQG